MSAELCFMSAAELVALRPDARDWFALPPAGTDWTAGLDGDLKDLRIADSPRLGYVREVHPKVEARVAAAVGTLAAQYREDLALRAAHVFQRATDHLKRPPL